MEFIAKLKRRYNKAEKALLKINNIDFKQIFENISIEKELQFICQLILSNNKGVNKPKLK